MKTGKMRMRIDYLKIDFHDQNSVDVTIIYSYSLKGTMARALHQVTEGEVKL